MWALEKQSEVQVRESGANGFHVELMRPHRRQQCLGYLRFAQLAYDESTSLSMLGHGDVRVER